MNGPLPSRWQLLTAAVLVTVLGSVPAATGDPSPELRLPPDAIYRSAESSPGPVTFSHKTHVPLADNRCVTCHPAPFAILQPTRGITHAAMNAGGQCGVCHNGTKASGVQDACEQCHRMGGDP